MNWQLLAAGLVTILSMARVWDEAFWKPGPSESTPDRLDPLVLAPAVALIVLTLGFTFGAGPIVGFTTRAAEQLLHPTDYQHAVLGER